VPNEVSKNIFDVNVFGTLNACKLALPLMGNEGKIINFASVLALFPVPYRGFYCASKAAVASLSDSLRMELSGTKIQVCTLYPGDVKTNFTKNRVKNFETNERYGDAPIKTTQYVDSRENKRMTIEFVTKKIVKEIERKKLKPMKIISRRYSFVHFLTRFFPKSAVIKVTQKVVIKNK
jgi:short-subunit dehydrogenase